MQSLQMLFSATSFAPWPLHPQPLDGESLTSWIVRQSDANITTVSSLLSSYLYNHRWDRSDLDLLESNELEILSQLGCVKGGKGTLLKMTLSTCKNAILQKGADQKSWISSISKTRYCPLCLSEGLFPYLRLIWRLHFIPICPIHHVALQTGCWNETCRYRQPLIKFGKGVCIKCKKLFSEAPIIRPKNCNRIIEFASLVPQILDKREVPERFNWSSSIAEFFNTLLLLVRYLNQYLPREPVWDKLLNRHGIQLSQELDWRDNNAMACVLLEKALHIIINWPDNMEQFINTNRSKFGRFCLDYTGDLPQPMKDFRSRDTGSRFKIQSKLPTSSSLKDNVTNAVQYLLQSNSCPYAKTVSRLTGINYWEIRRNSCLYSITQKGMEQFSKEEKEDIQNAVKALRMRGRSVTVRAVATYLGRSHRYFRKRRLELFKQGIS